MTPLKKFARWLWEYVTGEDPIVVSGHLSTMESLNGCHVRFIEQLEKDHPELKSLIEEHQKDRGRACNVWIMHCDKCRVPIMDEDKLHITIYGDFCDSCYEEHHYRGN